MTKLYKFGRPLLLAFYKPLYRPTFIGLENIPDKGPVILCSNHISNHDSVILGTFVKRPVYFMAKSELFKIPVLRAAIRNLGAFPIVRDAPAIETFRTSLEILKEGKCLCIFAQGRRIVNQLNITDVKAGVALFAMKSGAEVIPIKFIPPYKLFRRLQIKIGKPVNLDKYRTMKWRSDVLKEAQGDIVKELNAL